MVSLAYKIALGLYYFILNLASLFNSRAKEWLEGRKNNQYELERFRKKHAGKLIWVHCSSLGEFEQALPLIERIRQDNKEYLIAATFYSPSGYKYQKDNPILDWVGYIPHDTEGRMQLFIDTLNPSKAIIVKNEWWWNMIEILSDKEIDTYYISVSVDKKNYFIRHSYAFFKERLNTLRKIFVVNKKSKELLDHLTTAPVIITGDTKYDRAFDNKEEEFQDAIIEQYLPCIMYGSVWEKDVQVLKESILNHKEYHHILFPHNLDQAYIKSITDQLTSYDLYSTSSTKKSPILLVDKMGLLKYAYRYASIAYVGGGFGDGVHNLIEPAVYNIPVACGSNTKGIHEVANLKNRGVLTIVNNSEDFNTFIKQDHKLSIIESDIRSTDILYKEIMNNDF